VFFKRNVLFRFTLTERIAPFKPYAELMPGLPGRRAQAARNDTTILEAAREVFIADPKAPIAAVAERAGVGISALYRRWPGKEDLLRQLCHDGLRRYNEEASAALADRDDPAALRTFLTAVDDADLHSLTVHLAGLFTPTPEMRTDAERSRKLAATLVQRARQAGWLRPDVVVADLSLILDACAAVRLPDNPDRTRTLRRRLLAILLDGLSGTTRLPGPPPDAAEASWRWRRT